MDLKVSNTFHKTTAVYFKKANDKLEETKTKYRQIVSMGGSRSSKTYSILQILMLEMMRSNRLKITVWRDTKVTCRATVMEDFKKIIMFDDSIYVKFKENKQLGKFTYLPTNSEILFEGADSIGKVLGGAQDISYFNEVTEFSQAVYLQITQRTADRVICDYNPSKDFWLEKYRLDPDTVFIHSTFKDNAFCPPNIVKQLLSYEPWEPGSYEIHNTDIYYKGEKVSKYNQPPKHKLNWTRGTADEYMWLVYGLGLGSEKPNRIYSGWNKITLEEFESLEYVSYFGMDFGTSNPTAVVEVKYDGDGAFFVCPRFYKPLTNINESLPTVVDVHIPQIKKGKSIIVCDSAKETYVNVLTSAGYIAVKAIKGGGSVSVGITLAQGFTVYFVADEDFLKEYNNYSWHIDRYGKSTDEPVKTDDHYMDALRYILTYLVRFLNIKV